MNRGTNTSHSGVCALIVTYNPELARMKQSVDVLFPQVNAIVLVDNGSKNISEIRQTVMGKAIDVLANRTNEGIGRAINLGVRTLIRTYKPAWTLLLDQDTVLDKDYVKTMLQRYSEAGAPDDVWVLGCRFDANGGFSHRLHEVRCVVTSGSLIKQEAWSTLRYREEFFMDQIDIAFCSAVRKSGHRILELDEKLMDHEMGKIAIVSGRPVRYEDSRRFYYVVRNSSVLLLERDIDLVFYLRQLKAWAVPLTKVEGVNRTLMACVRGFLDALCKRLGEFKSQV